VAAMVAWGAVVAVVAAVVAVVPLVAVVAVVAGTAAVAVFLAVRMLESSHVVPRRCVVELSAALQREQGVDV